ncbi:hypothetical protein PIB30_001413 [Stylosanthes scabra]|uniref:Uncharacterized protein n=1 Tax=Stylosanthes scabra TaxID=79078 RepID=A0ABU6Z2J9_9FABA|nr:hypothetical protein [Stylosanthes scabra]
MTNQDLLDLEKDTYFSEEEEEKDFEEGTRRECALRGIIFSAEPKAIIKKEIDVCRE